MYGAPVCNGGGVYNEGTLTIENSTISGNTTGDSVTSGYFAGQGGGVAGWGGTLTIRNSTLSGNATGNGSSPGEDGDGGGVYANGATTIENSTISGNAARGYGGVYNYNESHAVTLIHVTLTNNTADSDSDEHGAAHGGGLSWRIRGGFIVKNSVIAGNTDRGSSAYNDCLGGWGDYTSQGYNLVGSGTGCPSGGTGDQTTSDPKLGPLHKITAAPPRPTPRSTTARRWSGFPAGPTAAAAITPQTSAARPGPEAAPAT